MKIYSPEISGSLTVTGSIIVSEGTIEGTLAGNAVSSSYIELSNIDGFTSYSSSVNTQIESIEGFPYTGSAEISGSLTVSDSFTIPVGTTAERKSNPSIGEIRYNTDDGIGVEVYNGNRWYPLGTGFVQLPLGVSELSVTANDAVAQEIIPLNVEYLVIAGGGGGGGGPAGAGAGAGGYRSSVSGESSGGGASAESIVTLDVSTNYTVTVGAGGTGGTASVGQNGSNGSNSVFNTITSLGGGYGAGVYQNAGGTGGSGGGGADRSSSGGSGTANQGYGGGAGGTGSPNFPTGGGGGASQAGGNASGGTVSGDGGDGVQSSITGTATYRAGGGGGGGEGTPTGAGGLGGGGDSLQSGTTNTGGGGGGAEYYVSGGNGGSGTVILRYPNTYTISVGAGLTSSTSTVGSDKVTTFTAGTDTISFS